MELTRKNPVLRAVMDTNVLYSALRSRLGASYELLRHLRLGTWTLLLSNTIVTEYEEVLLRHASDLDLDPPEIRRLLDDLCALAERHSKTRILAPMLPDPDDEAFAQLAVLVRSDALITHNIAHLAPARPFGVNVLTPRQFLAMLPPIP